MDEETQRKDAKIETEQQARAEGRPRTDGNLFAPLRLCVMLFSIC
jgi:hypothetical protein